MILLAGGEEEERTSVSRSTGRPCRRSPSLSAWLLARQSMMTSRGRSSREEERTKQRRPRGLAWGMEPHRIARPTSSKENTVERRGDVVPGGQEADGGRSALASSAGERNDGEGGATSLVPASAVRWTTALIRAGSGRATTRRRAGGGQRCARTEVVGRRRQLATARAVGGRCGERQERAGGGGGRSDNVGSNVVALGSRRSMTQGEQAADGATKRRGGRTTTASDESGHQTTGRHSSEINKSGL